MKRLVGIAFITGALTMASMYSSFAYTHPPVPVSSTQPSSTPSPLKSGKNTAHNAAREAALSTFNLDIKQAQNGRDLAFADANATLVQSLQIAGKDKSAKQAARSAFKLAAGTINSAYKQAFAAAHQKYKSALAANN